MYKTLDDQVAVLGICVDPPMLRGQHERLNYHSVHNARRAVDMLRMLSFDFALVGVKLPDLSTWDFLRQLRTAWPQQKWALVGGPISQQQEITARMFGATTLFDETPTSHELIALATRLHERAVANVLAGRFDNAMAPPRRAGAAAL
jgi:DNA-binding response OmpR family regulator